MAELIDLINRNQMIQASYGRAYPSTVTDAQNLIMDASRESGVSGGIGNISNMIKNLIAKIKANPVMAAGIAAIVVLVAYFGTKGFKGGKKRYGNYKRKKAAGF